MKDNSISSNEIFNEVQKMRIELEDLRKQKSKLKLKLFYDPSNDEYILELEKIKARNAEINLQLLNLNNQLLDIIKIQNQEK